jgi:hypothetical protein
VNHGDVTEAAADVGGFGDTVVGVREHIPLPCSSVLPLAAV